MIWIWLDTLTCRSFEKKYKEYHKLIRDPTLWLCFAIFLLSFYIWFVMTGARDLAIRFDLNAMASLGCVACRVYTFKMLQYIWRDMYVHILISQSMCWWIFEVSSIHFPWMVNFFTLCWCFIFILYTFIVLSLAWNQSGLFDLFF